MMRGTSVVSRIRFANRSLTVAAQSQCFRAARVSKRYAGRAISALLLVSVLATAQNTVEQGITAFHEGRYADAQRLLESGPDTPYQRVVV